MITGAEERIREICRVHNWDIIEIDGENTAMICVPGKGEATVSIVNKWTGPRTELQPTRKITISVKSGVNWNKISGISPISTGTMKRNTPAALNLLLSSSDGVTWYTTVDATSVETVRNRVNELFATLDGFLSTLKAAQEIFEGWKQ